MDDSDDNASSITSDEAQWANEDQGDPWTQQELDDIKNKFEENQKKLVNIQQKIEKAVQSVREKFEDEVKEKIEKAAQTEFEAKRVRDERAE